MQSKDKPYVFISYSSKNQEQAELTRNLLLEERINCWMAPYDIPAGTKYAHIIDEAIENCACFLLLLTKESQDSNHVEREIECAISYNKTIIPMRLDDCQLNSGFKYYIGNTQIVFVSEIDKSNSEMITIVDRLQEIYTEEMEWLLSLAEKINVWLDLPKAYVLNPTRVAMLEDAYEKLVSLLHEEGRDCKVKIESCPLGSGDATITFEDFNITIKNMEAFYEVIRCMDNFEIYPIGDEKVCFAGVIKGVAYVSPIAEA